MSEPATAAIPPAKSLLLSLAKGFRILEVFDGRETELNLSQIAQRAELDSGTAFRLVKTLVMLGYLRQVENAKRYYLGLKVLICAFTPSAGWICTPAGGPSCADWWDS